MTINETNPIVAFPTHRPEAQPQFFEHTTEDFQETNNMHTENCNDFQVCSF